MAPYQISILFTPKIELPKHSTYADNLIALFAAYQKYFRKQKQHAYHLKNNNIKIKIFSTGHYIFKIEENNLEKLTENYIFSLIQKAFIHLKNYRTGSQAYEDDVSLIFKGKNIKKLYNKIGKKGFQNIGLKLYGLPNTQVRKSEEEEFIIINLKPVRSLDQIISI